MHLYICTYAPMHLHTCSYIHAPICMHLCAYAPMHLCTRAHTHVPAPIHVHLYTCTQKDTNAPIHVRLYTCASTGVPMLQGGAASDRRDAQRHGKIPHGAAQGAWHMVSTLTGRWASRCMAHGEHIDGALGLKPQGACCMAHGVW